MRIIITLLLFQLAILTIKAQNTTIEGTVADSLDNPVELANVMAFYAKDSTVASFGITNSAGRYRLIVPVGEEYTLKASFIGYTTYEAKIKAEGKHLEHNILLKEAPKMLNEVEIKYELPITVNGDTVTYKTDEFTTGNERKLGNVLEVLPGFEIDDNGDIKVQGKKVDKVLVDGKEFFDGNSKLATENIPASAVDKIQLLRNYNDVSPMSGLNNEESLAINVKLDEDHKNMWFGDFEAAAGPQERYLGHGNLFYYSPKTNFNLIADANNVGKQSFTLQDYFRFSGGMRRVGRRSGSFFDMSSDEFGMSLMQNNRARQIDSRMTALNYNYRPNKKWNFSAYGIGTGTETLMQSVSNRTYINGQNGTQEITTSDLSQTNISGLGKITMSYTPGANAHVEYEAFVKASEINETDNRLSDFGIAPNYFTETDIKSPFSLEQTMVGYFNVGKRNVLSVESSWNYKEQVPRYGLSTSVLPFQPTIPLAASETYQLDQSKNITTHAIRGEANDYFILNKTNHINFSLGVNSNNQHMNTRITQQRDNGEIVALEGNGFNNDIDFALNDYYAGIHFKTKLGKLILSPGVTGHMFQKQDEQQGSEYTEQKTLLTPDFFAQYKFGSTETLSLNYNLSTTFTDVQNVALGGVIRNYNSWFTGNRSIENNLYHQVNLSYFNFNMFNHTNFFLMANYQRKYNEITESVSYQGTDRFSNPMNLQVWNDMWMGNVNFEKKHIWVKWRLDANVNYMTFTNQVEGQSNQNTSFSQEYTAAIETKFTKAPNIEIGVREAWNIYNSGTVKQQYLNSAPYADIETHFLKHFTLVADYQFNRYESKDGKTVSEYDFLNAALYFHKKDSPWEFKISGNNLLETKTIRRDAFSDNLVSTYSYYVQPRYFLFSIKYDL